MKRYLIVFGVMCLALFAESSYNTQGLMIEKPEKLYDNTLHIDNKNNDSKPIDDIFVPILSIDSNIKDILDVYEDSSNVLSLKDLLNKARDNYNLQAKDIAIQEAEATRDSIYGGYLPSFDIGYSYNHSKRNTSSWQPAINAHTTTASANWVLFDGASREFALLSNNALINAAIADKGYSKEVLFLQVISAYYNYFTLKGQIIAMEQKKMSISANVERFQVLYNAGLQTIDELEALKAELSLTQYQLENLKLNFEQVKLQLSLYTNINVNKLKLNPIENPKYIQHQSLNITMQEEQARSVEYKIGTITYWPTISLFDQFTWNSKSSNSANDAFITYNYPKEQNVFGLSLTWNIFNGFTTNRQKEALRLQNLMLQKGIEYAKNEQSNNIKFYKKSIDTALSQIRSAEASLKSATISFETISQKYNAQLVNYNDYLNSLSAKYDAEATYIQSLNNYELQKANYIFYSGQSLDDYVN